MRVLVSIGIMVLGIFVSSVGLKTSTEAELMTLFLTAFRIGFILTGLSLVVQGIGILVTGNR